MRCGNTSADRSRKSSGVSWVTEILSVGMALAVAPRGLAFPDERSDALLRVLEFRIRRHHGLRELVRPTLVELDLRVERLLADPGHVRAEARDLAHELVDGLIE